MRKEIKRVQIICDFCGQETSDPWNSVSEQAPVGVMLLRYDIWYGGGREIKDLCKPCQSKLVAFLEANKAVGNGQKTG
jgi:hypothetical protein